MSPTVGVLMPPDTPGPVILDYARTAERLGFGELWVVEDCFLRGGVAQAGAILASTSTIRVGVGILPAAVRNAAFTAMEFGTLAELFPGRLVAGVGHGMPAWMRQVGVWPQSPLTLLTEYVSAVRALLRGERVSVEGRYVRLDAVALDRPPEVVPPVLTGVRGPRSLAVSGAVADGTILAEPVTPEYLAQARRDINGPPDHQVVAYCVAAVDDDPDRARARVRPALRWTGDPDWAPHLAPLDFAADFAALRADCGSQQEFADRLPVEWLDRLAVVGTPERARHRIGELHAAGATSVILTPAGPDPMAALADLSRLI